MRLNVILFGKRVVASPYSLGPIPTAPLAHHLLESLARYLGERLVEQSPVS